MNYKHGWARAGVRRSPEYEAWQAMISRCYNPKHTSYSDYGGRGVRVCRVWKTDFAAFFAAVGRRPSKAHSIDRIDNRKGYAPGNVRWATRREQNTNKRTNIRVQLGCVEMPLSLWAELLHMRYGLVQGRIKNRGWDPVEALVTPPLKPHGRQRRRK